MDEDTYITAETNLNDEDHLKFFTVTKERMIINEIGNIGIGIDVLRSSSTYIS